MKKRLLGTLLSISLTISLGTGLSLTKPAPAQAFDTLTNSLSTSSPFTTYTYNHASVFQDMNVYHGIDVSYHNGNIDWDAVAADGVEYAFLRAGYRGYGNGSLQQDSKFTTYAADAVAAGIPIGVYYFTEATNEAEAIEEANDCIRIIQENNINVSLPIALDYEYQYNAAGQLASPKAGLSKAAATANCQAFCDTIAAAGYTPIIYANKSDLATLIDGAALAESYGIWLANYTTTTTYSGTYQLWQYTSSGSVDGIPGKVDCNFWYTQGDLGIAPAPKKDLKTAVVDAIPTQTYTGKQVKPALNIKLGSKTLTAGTHYTASYTNNINPGKATVTITGRGSYTGTLTKTFKIKPAAVTSLTAKTTASKITLTWKGSNAYSGYEIYRSTTYNGSYSKIKTISKNNTTAWSNKGLSKEREYYYKIRAYATVEGTTYYGPYTKISAGALSGTRAALNKKYRTILKKPASKAKKLVDVPYGATIRYLGKTVLKNKKKFYHVQYKKGGTLYDGYLSSMKGLKFRKALTTTAKVKLRSGAGTHTKALTNVPKNQPVITLSSRKRNGTVWYQTYYLKGKRLLMGYISEDYLQ